MTESTGKGLFNFVMELLQNINLDINDMMGKGTTEWYIENRDLNF